MNDKKTNYRNVYKSDHLGVIDLEEFIESKKSLVFTITHVNQEIGTKVAGRNIDANIAYFAENIKPLVLNSGNSKILKDMVGSLYVENWNNITVELYIDRSAKLKGEVVGGVRISPRKAVKQKPTITPEKTDMWERAKASYIREGNLGTVAKHALISNEHTNQLIEEVKSEQNEAV